jgi:hypothetical protein
MLLTLLQNNAPPSITTKVWIKISGVWKLATIYIKVVGVWKIATPNIKVAGVWK